MTKIPIEALKLAISGGYQSGIADVALLFLEDKTLEENIRWQVVALDREFWESLGRKLGWGKKMVIRRGTVIGNFCTPCSTEHPRGECFKEMGFGMDYLDPWVYYAHQFYDLILRGQDPTEFWNELLANK